MAYNTDPHVNSYLYNGSPSWVTGTLDWTSGQNNTNTAYMVNDLYSLLGGYLGRNYEVFACPEAAYYVSPVQRSRGWDHRVRSVAMNAAVGDGLKYETPGNPFGWTQWYVAKKTTDFNNPGPSHTWVFTDEHPDSIDDAMIYVSSYPTTTFTERPATSMTAPPASLLPMVTSRCTNGQARWCPSGPWNIRCSNECRAA